MPSNKEISIDLANAVRSHKSKVSKAKVDRDALAAKPIDEIKTSPHAKWLSTSALRMYQELKKIAKEFDDANPETVATSQDLVDILTVTIQLVKNK